MVLRGQRLAGISPPLTQSLVKQQLVAFPAQALHDSPQALHSATLGYFSHSFWQSLQPSRPPWPNGRMLRIDRRQCGQRAAGHDQLEGRIGATGHAVSFILYMPSNAEGSHCPSRHNAGGPSQGLVFRRMQALHLSAPAA